MRQLSLVAPGAVMWTDVPTPKLEDPRAALVRPAAVATCDFDHLLQRGVMPFPLPVALGHEGVAVVEQVGRDVEDIAPGDLVVIPFQVSCGDCKNCRRGLTAACSSVRWLSCYGLGAVAGGYGGFVSDVVLVPYADAMLVRLPPALDPAAAASVSCNMVDAYRCVGPQLAAHPGAEVLVLGGAFANIALYSARMAQALGAAHVSFFSGEEELRRRAASLGIEILDDLVPDSRYDITVDAAMDPQLLESAVRATARGGTLTASTMYADSRARLPLMAMFERCLTFTTGQPHARALAEPVLELMAADGVDLGAVTTSVVDWQEAPAAFTAGGGKTVLLRSS